MIKQNGNATSEFTPHWEKILAIIVTLKLSLFVAVALNTHFVMDEFWHFSQAKYLGNGIYETIWPLKTLGYAMFYAPVHWTGWDASSLLLTGRLQTAALAICLCSIVYTLVRVMGGTRSQAVLTILVLLCFSTFFERSFRLRAEPLATTFAAAALLLGIRENGTEIRSILIAGFLSGCAFLTTQKSVYLNFALGLGLITDAIMRRGIFYAFRRGCLLVLGWVIPIGLYTIGFGGSSAVDIAVHIFLTPIELASKGGGYYESLRGFLVQTILRNLPLYFLCFTGLLIATTRIRRMPSSQRIALVFTWTVVILVFGHNQPFPYVYVMSLPFLSVWVCHSLTLTAQRPVLRYLTSGVLAFVVIGSSLKNWQYLDHDNALQLDVVSTAEGFLDTDQSYFDGNAMIPNRIDHPRIWLDAETVRQVLLPTNADALTAALLEDPPYLFVRSYRSEAIRELLDPILKDRYLDVAPNILVPGRLIDAGQPTLFDVPINRWYALYEADGTRSASPIDIDGEMRTGPFLLERGIVQLHLPGDQPLFVLPADLRRQPQPNAEPHPLFKTPYTF